MICLLLGGLFPFDGYTVPLQRDWKVNASVNISVNRRKIVPINAHEPVRAALCLPAAAASLRFPRWPAPPPGARALLPPAAAAPATHGSARSDAARPTLLRAPAPTTDGGSPARSGRAARRPDPDWPSGPRSAR